jgi:hypothetical protein
MNIEIGASETVLAQAAAAQAVRRADPLVGSIIASQESRVHA